MKNRLKIAVWLLCALCIPYIGKAQQATGEEDRAFWVETLTRIADPVLVNLSNGTLKQNMPYESLGNRHRFSHLEAVGKGFEKCRQPVVAGLSGVWGTFPTAGRCRFPGTRIVACTETALG